jgi:tetratricopeptide (TPR) repeat protein
VESSARSRVAWIFFAVALVWFAIVALDYRDSPFFELPISDAQSYDEWAQRMAADGIAAEPVFHQPPLYPWALSEVYSRVEPAGRLGAALILHAILWALACSFLVRIAAEMSGRRDVAIAAGSLALLYGPLLFHTLKLIPTAIALATQAFAFWALLVAVRRKRRWSDLFAGAAIGLACLARAEMLLFLAAATLWIVWQQRAALKRSLVSAATVLLGAALLIAPVTLHNRQQGATVIIASAAGENLFIGNQRGGDGGHQPLDPRAGDLFSQRALAFEIASKARAADSAPLDAASVSRYWRQRAWDEIREQPISWLQLELRKLGRIFSPGDPTDMYSLSLERGHYLPVMWMAPLGTAALWLLCILGVTLLVRRKRALNSSGLWLAMLSAQFATLMIFFVSSRLRLPFIFWSLPLAAIALSALVQAVRQGSSTLRRAATLALLVLVAVSALELYWVRPSEREAMRLAAVLSRQQRLDESLAILTPLAGRANAQPRLLDQTGWVHAKKEEYATAVSYYEAALNSASDDVEERLNTGQTLVRLALAKEALGQLAPAWTALEQAKRERPEAAAVYFERGLFQLRRGNRAAATIEMERAATLEPKWPAPRQALQRLR